MSNKVNISHSNIEGKCDLKCSYNFDYTDDNSVANNNGKYILIQPQEMNKTLPVTFNKKKYFVKSSAITNGSSLLYNNKPVDAEITIYHVPENGGKELHVIIPIKSSSETSLGSDEITKVINYVANSAPAIYDKVNISFNIQKIIPNKPFVNFSKDNVDYIAFMLLDAIPLSSFTLEKFKKIIKPNTYIITDTGGLFLNSSGPNTSKELSDGIYISCNPTGVSEETEEVTYLKEDISFNIDDAMKNPYFILLVQLFFACLVFIIICFLWNLVFKLIDGEYTD